MENLKERIKNSEVIVNDFGSWNTDLWVKNILKNQIVIMSVLDELLEDKNKPKSGKA